MSTKAMYQLIGIIAMIATPLAAAILFGWQLYQFLVSENVNQPLAIVGGLAGAVAVESVGVFAGHTLIELIKVRDWRLIVPLTAMLFYVWFGWSTVPQYGTIFVLAGFVYLMVGLSYELEKEEVTVNAVLVYEQEQNALDRENERQLKRQAQGDKTAVALAKVSKKAPAANRLDTPVTSGYLPDDFRLLSVEQKEQIENMTTRELVQVADISDSTARRWKRLVAANGYHE